MNNMQRRSLYQVDIMVLYNGDVCQLADGRWSIPCLFCGLQVCGLRFWPALFLAGCGNDLAVEKAPYQRLVYQRIEITLRRTT